VLGICGGLQLLGGRIDDAAGVDGSGEGLGLLPLATRFEADKETRRTSARFGRLPEPWAALSHAPIEGYEIRHGATTAAGDVVEALPDGRGYAAGTVCGIYVHGLFEQPHLVEALLGVRPRRTLEHALDALGAAIEEHLDVDALLEKARG
jgi:adenosylcobyric acid synthase